MLRIRLSRVGRKHDPSYRMIVTERGRGPQTGNYVEQVGTYDARSDKHSLKDERISYWLSVGAQPSDTVHNLLVKAGILDAPTVNPLPKKSPIVSDPVEESDDSHEAGETEEEAEGGEADSTNEEATDDDAEASGESEEESEAEEDDAETEESSAETAAEDGNEAEDDDGEDKGEKSEE